jgi:predicted ATP-binding protein involved in virulence
MYLLKSFRGFAKIATWPTLIVLSNVQGTGKTTLLDAILNMMMRFGHELTKIEEDLFKNFTTALEYNVLLGIDDASTDVLRRNYEDLKT